jgi:hypothetical protein
MNCPWCGRKARSHDDEGWSCDACHFSFSHYYLHLWRKYKPLRKKIRECREQGTPAHPNVLARLQLQLDARYPDLPCLRLPERDWSSLLTARK